jgi:regulator of protease activity HflC (stomatin/prohibitin superfamily)
MEPAAVLLIVVALFFGLILFSMAVKTIRPFQKGIVERLGRYTRTAQPGLRLIFPFFESLRKADMREQVVDVPPQEVITRDNVVVTVDAVIYYEITDPVKNLYNVANFYLAITLLAQTNLRNVIGEMQLDESLTSREKINANLREMLDAATDKWGARVTRVELKRIEPPSDVTDSMHRQMKAERERRAAILEAEGVKQSQILRAEGERQSAILSAEGQAQAIKNVAEAEKFKRLTIAEGEGQAIERVYAAIHNGKPTQDLITIKYLETLGQIANGTANKVFIPYEATGLLSSLGVVKELFEKK